MILLNRYKIADLLIPLIANSGNIFYLVDRLKAAVLFAICYNPLGQPITDSVKAFAQLLRRSRIDINLVAELFRTAVLGLRDTRLPPIAGRNIPSALLRYAGQRGFFPHTWQKRIQAFFRYGLFP